VSLSPICAQWTVSATATPLSTILNIHPDTPLRGFDVIGLTGNAGTIYIGNSGVTNVPANAGGVATATQGFSQGPHLNAIIRAGDVYFVGTASDKAFTTAQP
jgi:hypothetical protein